MKFFRIDDFGAGCFGLILAIIALPALAAVIKFLA